MVEDLELEVKKILDMEIEWLKKSGKPPSSAFFIGPKGRYVAVHFDFRDKPKSKRRLKKIAKKQKATMVITLASALMTKYAGTSSDPPYFRRPVLFAYGESKDASFGISQEFDYDENGQVEIGNRMIWPDGSTGFMAGFLKRTNG